MRTLTDRGNQIDQLQPVVVRGLERRVRNMSWALSELSVRLAPAQATKDFPISG